MSDTVQKNKAQIKTEFQLKLDAIAGLAKHDEIDDAGDDLSSAIAKTIYIKKLRPGMQDISKYGVEGYKEYYKGETSDKVNPVALIARIGANEFDGIGYDCAKGEEQGKNYFTECSKETKAVNGTEAKVIRVLKTTVTRQNQNDKKTYYYAPIRKGKGYGVSNKQVDKTLESKFKFDVKNKGKLGELIVETCPQYPSGWLWLPDGKSDFCKVIFETYFGADVSDKRFCLYEMPETKGFLNKTKK